MDRGELKGGEGQEERLEKGEDLGRLKGVVEVVQNNSRAHTDIEAFFYTKLRDFHCAIHEVHQLRVNATNFISHDDSPAF